MMNLDIDLSLVSIPAPRINFNFLNGVLPNGMTASGAANGTRVNASGLIEAKTAPRFDYNPITLIPALLVEPAGTNTCTQSEAIDNAAWTLSSCTINADATVAPDSNTTADKIVSANATALTGPNNTFTATSAAWSWSFFVKAASGVQFVQLAFSGGASVHRANFDIQNGTVQTFDTTSATIAAYPNGWYRITCTDTMAAAGAGQNCYLLAVPAGNSARGAAFVGDGTKGFYAWGAQMELGATASSYIPTTSASVTRSADSLTFTIPAGVATLRYVFDDNSTQDVSVSAGSYTIPTTLNRAAIKTVYSL